MTRPATPDTIAVPVKLAREFVDWHDEDGWWTHNTNRPSELRARLRAHFVAALTPPKPEDVIAARELLVKHGYSVSKGDALAQARREGMEEAAQIAEVYQWPPSSVEAIAAAIRARIEGESK